MTRSASRTARSHLVRVARHGLQVALVDAVGLAQPLHVLVQQQHLGLHAERDRRGVHPADPGAEHDDLRGVDPGHAAHEHAAPAAAPLQAVRPHLRGHPPGDLAHRRQQRQRAVGQLHRLVRDRGGARRQQRVGAGTRRGQVQVGEQDLVGPHPPVLLRDRLLDLQDQLGLGPHVVGAADDGRPGRDEVVVRDRRAGPGVLLDGDLVAVGDELVDTGGRDRHPVLGVLDLTWDSYAHAVPPGCAGRVRVVRAGRPGIAARRPCRGGTRSG